MARRWIRPAPRRALQPVAEPELDQLESNDSDPDHLTFRQHVLAFFKELAAVVVGAVIVASLLRGFVGQMFLILSISWTTRCRSTTALSWKSSAAWSVERWSPSPILAAGSPAALPASARSNWQGAPVCRGAAPTSAAPSI